MSYQLVTAAFLASLIVKVYCWIEIVRSSPVNVTVYSQLLFAALSLSSISTTVFSSSPSGSTVMIGRPRDKQLFLVLCTVCEGSRTYESSVGVSCQRLHVLSIWSIRVYLFLLFIYFFLSLLVSAFFAFVVAFFVLFPSFYLV